MALITGEEKIKPAPRYWICTVKAMPRDLLDLSFVAIDEIQLCADLDRGHVFTERLLNRRGRDGAFVIGASTMERAIRQLLPGAHILSRPRRSQADLCRRAQDFAPARRSAIIAFSAEDVYAIAEWVRRQRGGRGVVLGALSPRTRNAQVEMYQNGDVDYVVATDAIGMGLNLDVDHVAFAADRKFDGWQHRRLNPAEMAQIAGRARRHLRDGTFGTTGRCLPLDEKESIEALEDHRFDPISLLQMAFERSRFSSLEDLRASLDVLPKEPGLTRAPTAVDQLVLEATARRRCPPPDQDPRGHRPALGSLPDSITASCRRPPMPTSSCRFSAMSCAPEKFPMTGSRARLPVSIAPTATSMRCRRASPRSAHGPLSLTDPTGCMILSIGYFSIVI